MLHASWARDRGRCGWTWPQVCGIERRCAKFIQTSKREEERRREKIWKKAVVRVVELVNCYSSEQNAVVYVNPLQRRASSTKSYSCGSTIECGILKRLSCFRKHTVRLGEQSVEFTWIRKQFGKYLRCSWSFSNSGFISIQLACVRWSAGRWLLARLVIISPLWSIIKHARALPASGTKKNVSENAPHWKKRFYQLCQLMSGIVYCRLLSII